MPLHVLDDHDRIVDDDADGEDETEQRYGIDGKAHRQQHRERPDQRHGNGDCRNEGGAPVLQEHVDNENDENECLQQGDQHLAHRSFHIDRRIVGDPCLDVLGKALRQPVYFLADRTRNIESVCFGKLIDGEEGGGLRVELSEPAVGLRAEFDGGHVAEPHDGAVCVGSQHDVAELRDVLQTPFGPQRILELLPGRRRLGTDAPRRDLNVLLADG